MIELPFKFWRRLRRYGPAKTMRKTRAYLMQRWGMAQTGSHWDEVVLGESNLSDATGATGSTGSDGLRSRAVAKHWYENAYILESVRSRMCPPVKGQAHQGLATWLDRHQPGRVFERALSIGSGSGLKEIEFVASGRVKKFVCYELGKRQVEAARAHALARGLSEKIEFHQADAFEKLAGEEFDLVYWHHSLHHMFDVDRAVRVSRDVLREDGLFIADEFVGPSRFQWSDANIELMNSFRAQLPERYFVRPDFPQEKYPRKIVRPSPEQVMRTDPSEAVQSADILRAIVKYFPNAEIRLLGGAVVHIGLEGIIGNFNEENDEDRAILKDILEIDRQAIHNPLIDTHFAAVLAEKRE